MPLKYTMILPFLAFAIAPSISKAKLTDSFRIHTDFPYLKKDKKLFLDVFYSSDISFKGYVDVLFYKLTGNNDSIVVLRKRHQSFKFKQGIHKVRVNFSASDTDTYYEPKFYEIMKRADAIAPGQYLIYLTVRDTVEFLKLKYLRSIDSVFSPTSTVRKDINSSLKTKKKQPFFKLRKPSLTTKAYPEKALRKSKYNIDKTVRRRGLTSKEYEHNEKHLIDLYYEDWFAGRYQLNSKEPLDDQLKKQEQRALAPVDNLSIKNDFEAPSLSSQFKTRNKEKEDEDETKGEISSTTNLSSGQEQNSAQDNNYEELRGMVNTSILNVPVQITGLYTTQDRYRKIKTSYLHFHYDADEAKNQLKQNLSAYNSKYSESIAKNRGIENLYGASIKNLQGQREGLMKQVNTGDYGSIQVDSSGNDITEEKRKKIAGLDRQISRYQQLLAQSKNTRYFDSTLVYAKTKDVASTDDLGYKGLQRKTENIMPESKAKGFLGGLTNFDAGMFPKTTSKFTVNGQMIKGIDGGYDFGHGEAGILVGKTEYVGRDGSLDKYTCYSTAAGFNPGKEQKLGLVYYGYTPDRRVVTKDNFFKNQNISTPSFFNPVNIISTTYEGVYFDNIHFNGEVAVSVNQANQTDIIKSISQKDITAYSGEISGRIPGTSASLSGSYEKVGQGFENNTLPLSLFGTEQYKIGGKTDILKAKFIVGVDYYKLKQNSFSSIGWNTKWGIDFKTNFKRYPNLQVSYKPFTTFRSVSDTFTIPQRPMFGSVWVGRLSYNIRRQTNFYRLSLLYNRNSSMLDTVATGSELLQFSIGYSGKIFTSFVNIGKTVTTGFGTVDSNMAVSFVSVGGTYKCSRQLSIIADQNIGVTGQRLSRYSSMGGFIYRPDFLPVIIRMNFRYNTYLLHPVVSWKQIYSGMVDLTYSFKRKKKT